MKNETESREVPSIQALNAYPAVELLSHPEAMTLWPTDIATNETFQREVATRNVLRERVDRIMSRLPRPDVSLTEAIEQRHVTENEVADLFASLSELLEESSDYQRILLYLPFEFLPHASDTFSSERLQRAAERFRDAYMAAWGRLLSIQDVRANFIDGDVLEVDMRDGDLPRVVKAAHLIPKLVDKGWLTLEDVIFLVEHNDDDVFLRSVADTLPVLADAGVLDDKAVDRLRARRLPFVDKKLDEAAQQPELPQPPMFSFAELEHKVLAAIKQHNEEAYHGVTKKRESWLKQEKRRKTVQQAGDAIESALIAGQLSPAEAALLITPDADPSIKRAFIAGVRSAIESLANANLESARALLLDYRDLLETFWQDNTAEVRDALTKMCYRMHALGVVDESSLKKHNLTVPALGGPFSKNLERMTKERADVGSIAAGIEQDPELSRSLFPALLLFGSRLKGYGSADSDIDLAVFVRPGVVDKDEMRARLKQLLHGAIEGDAVEFWLEQEGDRLQVHDPESFDPRAGKRYWTHILFGAAWEGNEEAIKELRAKLLVPYFSETGEMFGRDARRLYIEEMERDALQYRLMHKGYEKFFPPFGGLSSPHAKSVDGQSMFWDSGYRQTATRLYVNNVFLPKV